MSRYRERHPNLVNDLERKLFPFQESEEEQESFTREGRQRVDEWLRDLFQQLKPKAPPQEEKP